MRRFESDHPQWAAQIADAVVWLARAEAVTGQRSAEDAIANAERRLQRYYR